VPALQRTVNLHGRHVLEVAGASGSAKSEFLLQVQPPFSSLNSQSL